MKLGMLLKRIFNPRPIEGYVSEVDKFLTTFDSTQPEEPYAAKERKKHESIAYLRDHAVPQDVNKKIWQDF